MDDRINWQRPPRLKEGACYLIHSDAAGPPGSRWSAVTLLKYDPCPAFLIVQDRSGRWRCPRDRIRLPIRLAEAGCSDRVLWPVVSVALRGLQLPAHPLESRQFAPGSDHLARAGQPELFSGP